MFSFGKIINSIKSSFKIFWFVYCLFYDFWDLKLSKLDLNRKKIKNEENPLYYNYSIYKLKQYYFNNFFKKTFLEIDILWAKIMSKKYIINDYNTPLFRSYFRVLQSKQGFFFNFSYLANHKNFTKHLKNTFLVGFNYIWLGIRFDYNLLFISFKSFTF
jgi:hypothetical protein